MVTRFPLGAAVTIAELEHDPHPVLARLRAAEPVSWIPVLNGWLVTRYDLALEAMRDARRFTVDDPRFSTAQVIGRSMLSLDGDEHARHRAPFVAPFRAGAVTARFGDVVIHECEQLIRELAPRGAAELRREFAGPLATAVVANALGLSREDVPTLRSWYEAIVAAVTQITAGGPVPAAGRDAFLALSNRLGARLRAGRAAGPGARREAGPGARREAGPRARREAPPQAGSERNDHSLLLTAANGDVNDAELVSNAAVLLFGGIETTEAMIANATLHLLERPEELARVRADPRLVDQAIEESLRLEPAAAVIDRYATDDTALGDSAIAAGDLVRISIAAANRDPAVFTDPDEFDLGRRNVRRHLAFAQGPHVCVGVHLARLEARVAIATLLERLPELRLDPERPARTSGLVFRKPRDLHVLWS